MIHWRFIAASPRYFGLQTISCYSNKTENSYYIYFLNMAALWACDYAEATEPVNKTGSLKASL